MYATRDEIRMKRGYGTYEQGSNSPKYSKERARRRVVPTPEQGVARDMRDVV